MVIIMKKRFVSIMLLLSVVLSAASCGDEGGSSDTTVSPDDVTGTTAPQENEDPRGSVSDDLPEKNYGGAVFTIATETGNEWMVIQEESTGDVVDDAVYKRNLAVEDRFGVKLAVITDGYTEISQKISNMVQSGDDSIDLCMIHVVQAGKTAVNDIYMNWNDVPYVDFSKPWWADSTVDDLTVDDVCLLAVGDFALSALANTYCMFYNKKLAEDYGIGDLYPIVNEGKWTIDKLLETTKDSYVDVNSDGRADGEDQFGFVTTSRSALNTYLWSFGGHVLKKNNDGDVELVYHSDRTSDMVTKLCSVFYDNNGIYINSKEPEYSSFFAIDTFNDCRAVFINGSLGNAVQYFRDMKDDFGILPYPKWNEAQENYYTMVDGSHDVLAVPASISDVERVGIITEALCAESYKKLVPAYYEVALKTKYTRDDESIAMIDMIAASRVFDLGYVYDGWKGASFIFQNLIAENNPNFESYWASKESSVTEYYDKVIDYFENYGK